jgi:hypothetical protein
MCVGRHRRTAGLAHQVGEGFRLRDALNFYLLRILPCR